MATRNPGKLAELRRLLAPHPWRVMSLDDAGFGHELPEPGTTYEENALSKAVAVARETGLTALADDSGIEVEALRGWPGPESARWRGGSASGAELLAGLIEEVARLSPEDPRVRYVCVLALARPDAEPVLARGECLGTLVEPHGEHGFGYDPGFLSLDLGVTFGQAPDADKDRVSHRGRAVARLAQSGVLDAPAGASSFLAR